MFIPIHAFCKTIFSLLLLITINATAQPTIGSFTPVSGPVGTSVIITGTSFNAVPANNIVYVGAVKASVTSGTTASLTITVPAGTSYQPISVLDNATGLSAYSSRPFITTFINPFGTGIPADFYNPKVDFTAGTNPRNAVISDLDGDGRPDLVVSNGNTNNISVLRNVSTPGIITAASFAAKVDFASGTFTSHVVTGDIDGDGKHDLVVVNNNNLSVLRNTSTPGAIDITSFAAKIDFDLVFTGPVFVAVGDVDGDGRADLVAANSGSASVSVLRNTSTPGTISFAPKVSFTTGTTPFCVAIGDMDGDGKPDLAVANSAVGANTVSILHNTSVAGTITFAPKSDFATGTGPRYVSIGDLDGDGKPDLAIANSDVASTTLSVLLNTSVAGTITLAAKSDFTTGTSPRSVAMGDANGDGRVDLVAANINSTTISVLSNTSVPGVITFAAKSDFATGMGPVTAVMGDIDGDGIPEIAAANGTASSVSVFQVDLSGLPVTITNVKAYLENAGVQIEWTSQQEINIEGYEVERSQNGRQFIRLGTIPVSGNSNIAKSYQFFDTYPLKGINFYRIKIIEAGHVSYSLVVRINMSIIFTNMVTVYPNPVKENTIAAEFNLPKGTYNIVISNQQGQQAIHKLVNHPGGPAIETIVLPVPLAKGVYQLSLTGEGVDITRQIIKN